MSTSSIDTRTALVQHVRVTDEAVEVDLTDGRTVLAPLAWYPRLLHATPTERNHWRVIGQGEGIHWPDLEEDISVESILSGRPSMENASSLARWLKEREENHAKD
jgi:hypothetical protein